MIKIYLLKVYITLYYIILYLSLYYMKQVLILFHNLINKSKLIFLYIQLFVLI